MTAGPILRALAASEAPALAALHARAIPEPWSTESFATLLASPGVTGLGMEERGLTLAFAVLRQAADEAELLTLVVAAPRRRQGLGRRLLEAVIAQAAADGAATLHLEVADDNAAARALYTAQGFAIVGRRRRYYASGADGLAMRRKLARADLDTARTRRHVAVTGRSNPPEPGMPSRLEKLCAARGLRMTEQRRVIARVLSDADDHPDAEELYRRAMALDPKISLATVYRTMKLFEDAGIIERHDFRDGRSRYEETPESHHDHLIDLRTGRVVEFVNEEIERLQVRIAKELGYCLVDHRLELYGVPLDDKNAKDPDAG